MITVYVLQSKNHDKLYVGMTENLSRRIVEHNQGKSKFTSAYQPWKVIYSEEQSDYKSGRIREKYLKTAAGKKFLAKKAGSNTGSLPA